MDEVSGAVIAIALVLSAVFIPTAFVSGITGKFYQQFALTIAVSTLISAFNSLTLSPALARCCSSPHTRPRTAHARDAPPRWIGSSGASTALSRRARPSIGYGAACCALRRDRARGLCGIAGLTWFGFHKVPTGFIPSQDKGSIFCFLQLPDGASLQRTEAVSQRVVQLRRTPPASPPCRNSPGCRWSPWATAPMRRACSFA